MASDSGAQHPFPGKKTKLPGEKAISLHMISLPGEWIWHLEEQWPSGDPEDRDLWHPELLCQPGVPTLRLPVARDKVNPYLGKAL